MIKSLLALVPFISLVSTAAFGPANQVLERRGAYAGGGWCLISADDTDSSCPPGNKNLGDNNEGCCCPDGYVRSSTDFFACCQPGSACGSSLDLEPFCADSSWVLWNATDSGYFCCLQGQVGTQQQECAGAAVNVPATLSAQMVSDI